MSLELSESAWKIIAEHGGVSNGQEGQETRAEKVHLCITRTESLHLGRVQCAETCPNGLSLFLSVATAESLAGCC